MKKEMKPDDIRKAGWSLMLGAAVFVPAMYWETSVWDLWILGFPLLLVSIPMMAYGLRGLQTRYGETAGSLGQNILQVGAILGPLTTLLGFIGGWSGLFFLFYAGPAIVFTCLTLFGVVALFKKPLLNWKALAVFAGTGCPTLYSLIGQIIRGTNVFFSPSDLAIMIIPCIALIALGYILVSGVPQETATA